MFHRVPRISTTLYWIFHGFTGLNGFGSEFLKGCSLEFGHFGLQGVDDALQHAALDLVSAEVRRVLVVDGGGGVGAFLRRLFGALQFLFQHTRGTHLGTRQATSRILSQSAAP